MGTALIILAAGKGTRMKSDKAKVLHQIACAPMLVHALRAGQVLEPDASVVVVGHDGNAVAKAVNAYDDSVQIAHQTEQLGTAHAVSQAATALKDHTGDAIVLYGDTPFISEETLLRMAEARKKHDVVVLGFNAADPGRYGRLVMQGDTLERIIEFKDADEATRAISFCNSGVVAANANQLFMLIDAVGNNNASGEYYLTDIVEIARKKGLSATAVACDETETMGINSRAELAQAEAAFQARARVQALDDGITLPAPETVHFAFDTVIGRDTIVEQNVVLGPGVTVESGAHIRAFSHLEGCHVSRGAIVGPYARLRPGTELAEDTRIGNFVEIKNAVIDEGAKVNHLSYVGDAHLGEATNVGAGTITCNYDGVMKHHTEVGKNAFIGSNTMLIAPVTIGDNAMTASGSVINKDVPDGAMAVARAPQVTKLGFALKLFEMLKSKKIKRDKGAE
ncbi:bifunctional UDP-N-acetylglucosamine diphosphorylase/glucosamine-1-phosphate N-acetyltransferase GlmU [uncultured Roseovarius sp.]|uniref:bifunctional UDP-N-acetylglucosamine diphosphorylase/glucosamine-1-phosphate N-acetyltransferase GlmU n=1 Tax=uncultured Roseovarius sp. TaxID=293344 RepID=UPI002639E570|nr:bifunctional UDP-N-acetylglucosamine diphosphorylase/glucosamine-1-phosphate N-acetyltransferase GlmU [uncultured Roseovarius sp.]